MQPNAEHYLAEPSRLVYLEPALDSQLDDVLVSTHFERQVVGSLVRLEATDWLDLHDLENVFALILRPAPDEADMLPGFNPVFRWERM